MGIWRCQLDRICCQQFPCRCCLNLNRRLHPKLTTERKRGKMLSYLKAIPTHMDFDGQARAENLSRIIVVLFGVVGLIWGYIIQQFSQTVYILGAGLILATILTVPPWPLYRLKPLTWQKVRADPSEVADSKSNKKKK